MTAAQIVNHHDAVAQFQKLCRDGAADISGSSGNQNAHSHCVGPSPVHSECVLYLNPIIVPLCCTEALFGSKLLSRRSRHRARPDYMTPEEFRKLGHQMIDWVADYRARIASLPVTPRTAPGEIRAQLPADPPDAPESFDAIFRDLDAILMPGLLHWQHPALFGFFPSDASLAGVLGIILSTGCGL